MARRTGNVYTVAQVNSYIKNMFTQDYLLRAISVRGEISNCKYHPSGHIYFTLKDEKETLGCVMFAGSRQGLKFTLKEGQQVIVTGTVDVYERDGKYQLYARQIVQDGIGLLYEEFELLKRELEEMGMFSPEYKQPIPRYIRTLGVVTAGTGAAVRDIIQISQRRNPYVRIILYPAIVQGEAAPESIVKGIRALEKCKVDVMIVGRGGGSMEDLWAFNDVRVAQAVFDCSVPVISAVGHETDTTIIDYVADLRAPTPSAAAELAVFSYTEFQDRMDDLAEKLAGRMQRILRGKRELCGQYERQLRILSPAGRVREQRTRLLRDEERLIGGMEQTMNRKKHTFALYLEKMKGLSPLERLDRGYSYVEDISGRNVRSIRGVKEGDPLHIRVRDGVIDAVVSGIEEREQSV